MFRSVNDVKIAFHKYDVNGDGKIDLAELTKALTNYKLNFSEQVIPNSVISTYSVENVVTKPYYSDQ